MILGGRCPLCNTDLGRGKELPDERLDLLNRPKPRGDRVIDTLCCVCGGRVSEDRVRQGYGTCQVCGSHLERRVEYPGRRRIRQGPVIVFKR